MSAWTGTRVPAKTGVPLRMSGDDVTIGCAMGFSLLSAGPWAQGRLEAANAGADPRPPRPSGLAACWAGSRLPPVRPQNLVHHTRRPGRCTERLVVLSRLPS